MHSLSREELANSATHGLGAILSAVGLTVLLVVSSMRGDVRLVVSWAVFGVSLLLLYSASTLYHSARRPRQKRLLHIFDHVAIYFLIAGTYTPFALGVLRGPAGWVLFGIIWGLALLGATLKIWFTGRFQLLSLGFYLGMGWLALAVIRELYARLSGLSFTLLVLGGLAYSAGVFFYSRDDRVPYFHAVWHGFVMLGSGCHFFSVLASQ